MMRLKLCFLAMMMLLLGCVPSTNTTSSTLPTPPVSTTPKPLPIETKELEPTETNPPTAPPTSSPTATPTTAVATATPTPSETPAIAPSPTWSILVEPTIPSEVQLSGPDVSIAGVQFTIDPTLYQEIILLQKKPKFHPAAEEASTYFFFDSENRSCQAGGLIEIHPVKTLQTATLPRPSIEQIIERIGDPLSGPFPSWESVILLQTPTTQKSFPSGRGIQAVVIRAQNIIFAYNEPLFYDFQGITEDGLYFVHFCYPVSSPLLPDEFIGFQTDLDELDYDDQVLLPPEVPDGGEELETTMLTYNEQVAVALEQSLPSSFNPDLTLLDAVVESLKVDLKN